MHRQHATALDILAPQMSGSAADGALHSVQIVSNLSESVSQVREIVKIINSIADQINLLALNEAIDSTRAGKALRADNVSARMI
jgi:methyl-accepting chemotaxis protein